jgi:hypothetical protein
VQSARRFQRPSHGKPAKSREQSSHEGAESAMGRNRGVVAVVRAQDSMSHRFQRRSGWTQERAAAGRRRQCHWQAQGLAVTASHVCRMTSFAYILFTLSYLLHNPFGSVPQRNTVICQRHCLSYGRLCLGRAERLRGGRRISCQSRLGLVQFFLSFFLGTLLHNPFCSVPQRNTVITYQ